MEADLNERTATLAIEAIDKDRHAVAMSVAQIMSVLHDFIPHACRYEAEQRLFDAMFINGTELTSNMMRKEYEQWKKLEFNALMLKPSTGVQP
jgi:hypothetical protein